MGSVLGAYCLDADYAFLWSSISGFTPRIIFVPPLSALFSIVLFGFLHFFEFCSFFVWLLVFFTLYGSLFS